MSRYTVHGHREYVQIDFGWDPGLQTYFAAVYDLRVGGPDDVDEPHYWVGTNPHELQTVDALIHVIRAYGKIDDNLIEVLKADKAAPSRSPFLFLAKNNMF